jgi:Uma2 family endonuclease
MIVAKHAMTKDPHDLVSDMEHVVLFDVSWAAYEAILEAMGDRRLRHSYDNGTLELMSPLKRHDRAKKILSRMIEAMALELDIDIQSIGSTTLRKQPKKKGLEPDECYYVAHEPQVRSKPDYDPSVDPPPDLALEVDVTRSSVSRMGIYAGLGVPEVWRMKGETLSFHMLEENGKYVSIERSLAFPRVTPGVLQQFLSQRCELRENELLRNFLAWLRKSSKKGK